MTDRTSFLVQVDQGDAEAISTRPPANQARSEMPERMRRAADARMRMVFNDYHQPLGWEPGQPRVYSPGEAPESLKTAFEAGAHWGWQRPDVRPAVKAEALFPGA